MRLLGAEVRRGRIRVPRTLKDAMNEALRDWVANVEDTFYIIGSVAGPHPYPAMVRDFQCVIGDETRAQMQAARRPAAGFAGRLRRRRLQRHGPVPSVPRRRARSRSTASKRRATACETASMRPRSPAASPACCTATALICCRTTTARSWKPIRSRAGLDYPGIGPEHAWLKDMGRVKFLSATDDEALDAFQLLLASSKASSRRWNPRMRIGARVRARAAEAEGSI